jgi:hypothetical protein
MINIVYRRTIPEPPYDNDLFELHNEAIPSLLGGIWLKSQRYFWATPEDWARGRQLLALEGENILMPGTALIVNAVNNVYSLLDARLGGNQRTNLGIDPGTGLQLYDPIIRPDPDPEDFTAPGMQHASRILEWGMLNLLTGELNGPYGDTDQVKQLLRDLIAAAGEGTDLTEVLDDLGLILTLLG